MQIIFTPKAKEHFDYWVKTGNKMILKRIYRLTSAILEDPFKGIGKPEPLKGGLTGYWSRRITKEHRCVYMIKNNTVVVASLKGHY